MNFFHNSFLSDETTKAIRLDECKEASLKFLTETPNILESVNRDVKAIILEKFEDLALLTKEEGVSLISPIKRKATDGQIQQRHQKLRRFDLVDDIADTSDCLRIFDDWDWSSDEFDCDEVQTGKQDKEPLGCTKLHLNFYDDSDVRNDCNDFNFWKLDVSFPLLPSLKIDIKKEDRIAREDPTAQDLLMEWEGGVGRKISPGQVMETKQKMFPLKPSKYQTTTKYKWPQTGRQRGLFYESRIIAQNPKNLVKRFPVQTI